MIIRADDNSLSDELYLSLSLIQQSCDQIDRQSMSESKDLYDEYQEARPLLDFGHYFDDSEYRVQVKIDIFQQYQPIGQYKGQSKQLRRWGRGTFHYENGETFEGHFIDDRPVGRFNFANNNGQKLDAHNLEEKWHFYKKQTQTNGMFVQRINNKIYIGGKKYGEQYGQGKLFNKVSSYYGSFKEFAHGSGVLKGSDGLLQTGEYFQGFFQGFGRKKFTDGTIYIGQLVLDQPWGMGCVITQKAISKGFYINGKREAWFQINTPDGIKKFYYADDQLIIAIVNTQAQLYVGDTRNENLNGQGTYCTGNRDIQSGQFKDGVLEGYGVTLTNNMQKQIKGQFSKGIPQGIVIYTEGNNIYYGQLLNGFRHGFGLQKGLDFTYEGNFMEDCYHGYGTYKDQECDYKGEWKMGKFNGKGKIINRLNGENYNAYYQGDWVNGQKHGKGKFRALQGLSYDGDWNCDKMEGYGVRDDLLYQYKYKGEHKNSQPLGLGRYIWGDFIHCAYQQVGVNLQFSYQSKDAKQQYFNASIINGQFIKCVGEVRHILLHGQGILIIKDQINIGNFIEGYRSGLCQIIEISQKCFCSTPPELQYHKCHNNYHANGYFINNQLVSGLMKTHTDKCVGDFKNVQLHGFGTFITVNGILQIGQFKEGKLHGHGIEYNKKHQILLEGQFKEGKLFGNFNHHILDMTFTKSDQITIQKQVGLKLQSIGVCLDDSFKQGTLVSHTQLFQGDIQEMIRLEKIHSGLSDDTMVHSS